MVGLGLPPVPRYLFRNNPTRAAPSAGRSRPGPGGRGVLFRKIHRPAFGAKFGRPLTQFAAGSRAAARRPLVQLRPARPNPRLPPVPRRPFRHMPAPIGGCRALRPFGSCGLARPRVLSETIAQPAALRPPGGHRSEVHRFFFRACPAVRPPSALNRNSVAPSDPRRVFPRHAAFRQPPPTFSGPVGPDRKKWVGGLQAV